MANGLCLQVFWICALLINGCAGATISKDYRFRTHGQDRNIGDDADDERFISAGSESEDGGSKPASNPPQWGSSQRNVQTRPGGQGLGQLVNRVAHVPVANDPNKPLVFPPSVPASPQLGAGNQQSSATGLTNGMPSSSSGLPVYAPQSGGPHSGASAHKGLRYEDVFDFVSQDSGPGQLYGARRGHDEGRSPQQFVSRGSGINAGGPSSQTYPQHVPVPSRVMYSNFAPASYDEGLNSNLRETVPQWARGQVMPPPPPPPLPLYNPVYYLQSRAGYSHARYTHSRSKYSPDLHRRAPVPVMVVDRRPPQDVPGVGVETRRGKW